MVVITKISIQQKNKERYNIYTDDGTGEKYAFSVHQDVLISEQLQKGTEIDELDLEEIIFADDISKAFQQAVNYLSYRMRSTLEIIQYLKDKDVNEPVIQETIQKLRELKFLDDRAFAEAYVKTHSNISSKGPVILRKELVQKGISSSIIDECLELLTLECQIQIATKLAEKAIKKANLSSEKMIKQKINEALMRKGFTSEIISIVVEETLPKKDEDVEWEAICQAGAKAHNRFKMYEGFEYKQKIKQYLYRKGFSIDVIGKYLDSNELQEESASYMDF
jgi:regulatory protein